MFTKALIVEDQATIGRSLMDVLPKKRLAKEAFITHYCDDALFKIRAELKLGKGYDLLVTDLSFIEDKHPQKIKSGYELIAAVRDLHIDINIAVISVETRIAPIRELFEVYKIDAFIEKGRDEIQELIAAVQELKEGGIYKSKNLIEKLKNYSSTQEITAYDCTVIKLLAKGYINPEIADYLKKNGYTPHSLRSLELRLNQLRSILEVRTNSELIATALKLGII